ncbi:2-polyprenyl-6-methoxyphenol hydroxylase-like FAD-dependent oxidoreductase [Maritimibacter alkaliphilus HTCC2654]|uniref:FAD-binding domain-containing protein n=1 Tax=Maritimibacter alkaliphilus HTCC2654 TaxID=314271 RepID=A3VDM0_9RHOB|nr:FAD-dependent oxidoreductase [Maritimibacter alkaliphilus]EAQ13609.1 hypothetical protein RB2654_02809 [Maritimibacter alkaliphilus HTCC2654]TYP83448.1 2-polyprenyl-6-methoxyphenol hydroxylase-like FAD-dependent oxidoreductase [Maritimibacter alkaliphilus HTCC2654]
MVAAFETALIIGGGIAGMSAALSLHEAGVNVRLIDRDAKWGVSGAGITITGPTLRVMKRLGILDDVLKAGWTSDDIRACDAEGNVLADIEGRTSGGEGIPGAGGIMRPTLHRLLAQRIRDEGIEASLGLTVTSMSEGSPKVVSFSDGTEASYDLVVAADGIFSETRKTLFPEVEGPKYVGQVCWRLMAPRHPGIDRRTYFLGGPMKIGMNPVSPDEMYMFLLEPVETVEWIPEDELSTRLAKLMESYGGIVADVREGLTADSNIVARPLETVVCPAPWYRDGVVLIGDAAHATTPQLASGAGMAMEDGVVLGECAGAAATLDDALDAFMKRRFDRCAFVVDKSLTLGRLEKAGSSPIDQIKVVEEALAELNQPY